MAVRYILVPSHSALLQEPSTVKIHTYPSGEVLVRTEAAASENGGDETPAEQGVQLTPEESPHLEAARETLTANGTGTGTGTGILLAYVEMAGPIASAWLKTLRALGVTPLRFQPQNTYLCRGTKTALKKALQEPFVVAVTPLTSDLKPVLKLPENLIASLPVWIVAQGDASEANSLAAEMDALPDVDLEPHRAPEVVDFFLRIPARVRAGGEAALRAHKRVLAVEKREPALSEDEVADLIVAGKYDASGIPGGSYLDWLDEMGLSGDGVTIGIVDAGVDISHEAFADRARDLTGGNKDWHGTFVAGHAVGAYLDESDTDGFIYGLGVAPRANLIAQDNQRNATDLCLETVSEDGLNGVRGFIQNNSWGMGLAPDPARLNYGSLEASYDSLVRNASPGSDTARPLTICFSTGNSGSKGLTRPKSAKNILVTGNSENARADVGHDESDNINEVYTGTHASSWGNCGDGRIKPDIVAPGEWTASANFDSHEGDKEFISPKLTWGGGSSGASPKTAGVCALLTQWWHRQNNDADPSPALLRALIVNGAEPLNFKGPIPNKYEGWGRLNLANILDETVHHTYVDQTLFLADRGERKEWTVRVSDPQKPLKVTLCWTDPPGAVGSGGDPANSAIVNSLVLRVNVNGDMYRGNNFQGGCSVSGTEGRPQAEGADNLQNVFLSAGTATETVQVVVEARNITTDCLTNRADNPRQDFALVITNGHLDEGFTPADVFLVVDDGTNATDDDATDDDTANGGAADGDAVDGGDGEVVNGGGEGPDDGNFWTNGNSDNDELEGGPEPVTAQGGVANGSADDWWDGGENGAQETRRSAVRRETVRDRVPPANGLMQKRPFAETVLAGVEVATVGGEHRVLLSGSPALGAVADAAAPLLALDATSGMARAGLARRAGLPFGQALRQLDRGWHQFGTRDSADQARRAAVVVVGTGTRVSREDLMLLRRLGHLGQVYLVSDSGPILSFLAQRIHRRTGVQFRLADDAESLAALVRDTLIEASGAQRMTIQDVVPVRPGVGGAGTPLAPAVQKHRFEVVAADRRLTIHITVKPGVPLSALRVKRPGQADFAAVDLAHPPAWVQGQQSDNTRVLTIAAPAPSADGVRAAWAGIWEWELILTPPAPSVEPQARFRAWVWGGLHLRATCQEVARAASRARVESVLSAAPTDETTTESFIKIEGDGAQFTQLKITARPISDFASESPRDIIVAPRRSRLDRVDVGGGVGSGTGPNVEVERDIALAPTLSSRLPPQPRQGVRSVGAKLSDLTLGVQGQDAAGGVFRRLIHTNTVDLEPRSAWRARVAPPPPRLVILQARVAEVLYDADAGGIAGLRLEKPGDPQSRRTVTVSSPDLRRQLGHLDLNAPNLLFHVSEGELLSVVVALSA